MTQSRTAGELCEEPAGRVVPAIGWFFEVPSLEAPSEPSDSTVPTNPLIHKNNALLREKATGPPTSVIIKVTLTFNLFLGNQNTEVLSACSNYEHNR